MGKKKEVRSMVVCTLPSKTVLIALQATNASKLQYSQKLTIFIWFHASAHQGTVSELNDFPLQIHKLIRTQKKNLYENKTKEP